MSKRLNLLQCFYSFSSIRFIIGNVLYMIYCGFRLVRKIIYSLRMCIGEGGRVGPVAAEVSRP